MTRLITLPAPEPGVSVYEPHVAIDPADPDRIAVGAQYGIRGGRGARNLQLWLTEDAGETWFSTRVPRPARDQQFAADPLVAFDTDSALLFVGDCGPRLIADTNDSLSFTRNSAPPVETALATMFEGLGDLGEEATADIIGVSRTTDGGHTFAGTLVGPSPIGDKPAIAVDRNPSSPYYGAVYVLWADPTPGLFVARSLDGGRSFEPAVNLQPWVNSHGTQIAVRPDGSVHVVSAMMSPAAMTSGDMIPVREGAPADAKSAIYHAVSTDGGETYSPLAVVATNNGPGMVGIPSLAVDDAGRMIWVWSQADTLPDIAARPLIQPRHRLCAIACDDGLTWSKPTDLLPHLPDGTHMGLPAVCAGPQGWCILTYLADEAGTKVALLRQDGADTFDIDQILAARAIPVDEISLMGSYLLRFCDDAAQLGDYVGIASVGNRLACSFILPATDESTSTATAHVAIIDAQ